MHHEIALLATVAVGLALAFLFGFAADKAGMSVQAMRLVAATAHMTPARPEPVA